jgi:virginiamycin B lyase
MSIVALLALLLALFFDAPSLSAATGVFRGQAIPGSPAGATEVVRGPDGGFWFTEFDGNRIGNLSRDGQYREFNVPTPNSGPRGIASSFDAIWFTELKAGKIGRLTPAGVFTEYVLPSPQSQPWGIAFAFVSGAIWFTEAGANKIGRLVPDGTVTEFLIPTSDSEPRGIASGDFGSPCFAEFNANQIACVDGNGRIVERPLPTPNSGPEAVANMTNLGNLWFTETRGNRIGVIRFFNASSFLDARIEEFLIPTSASGPAGLAAEYYEGSAWFAEKSAGQIGFISSDGRITEYPLPNRSSQPTGISVDVEVRFLDAAANRLVEIQPDAVLVAGAGASGSWQTEFRLASVENDSVTALVSVNPRPTYLCGVCIVPEVLRKLSPNGSVAIGADQFRSGVLGIVFVRALEDGVLPSVKARVFNANAPSQSLDLPTIRLSRLTELNPSLLSFPGAVKSGAARSNLWLAEAGRREPLEVVIELIDPDGHVIASRDETLGAGRSVYLVDVIGGLGVGSFPDGQLRVRKSGNRGLLWGYLATVDVNGATSLFSGLNP